LDRNGCPVCRGITDQFGVGSVSSLSGIRKFPRYLIFGAGQGFDGRFMEPFDGNVIYEVHSSLIAPLFYYGIIGFGLLYTSFYLIARDRLVGWQWLVFAAPFVYGLFTYGLRTPIFWIMLASLYTITPRHRQRVSD
jgi:hypothetical protein